MPENIVDEQERSLDSVYKHVCEFEKPHYEKLNVEDDGTVVLTIDKELYLQLENHERVTDDIFEPVKYSSYSSLFNDRYKNNFQRNLTAIKLSSLENELGKDTLTKITQKDQDLKKLYTELTKERDLDNDGVPDRIDIDDTRNSVQTVSDLSAVKNSTNESTQRHHEKNERQRKERRERIKNREMEL